MQSRRDLYQAHQLMTQRASLALLRGEPDIPDQPLRRLNVAAISSVLVGVIAVALFAILGLLGHGSPAVQDQPGTLVIDKDTGTSYVFCRQNPATLCPMLNYASARLFLQTASVTQDTVSQGALSQFARGPMLGIAGLPPLPGAGLLVKQPWSVCTETEITPSVGKQAITTVAAGISAGGSSLNSDALLVQAQGQGQDWVVWDGQRMAVQPGMLPDTLSALQTSQTLMQVPPVWLDALPQGQAFAAPAIPDKGALVTGPTNVPTPVGQVFKVTGSTQFYVMLASGRLAPVTPMQAALLYFAPGVHGPITLNPSQVTDDRSTSTVPAGALPSAVPTVVAASSSAPLCVVYSGTGASLTRQVETGGTMPPASDSTATGLATGISQVALPPGEGALVGAAPGTGQGGGAISYFLVTGGRRYALSSEGVAAMLGYSLSQAVSLPAGVVDLIPSGPPLDPALAVKQAVSG
jgi:ESX secretion system ATPase EccB